MTTYRTALVSMAAAFCIGVLIAGCGGGGDDDTTKTAVPSSAATSAGTPATTNTSTLGIRALDLSTVADVDALIAETGGQYLQASVIYADLTDDGSDEAIVPINSGGTMGDIAFLVLTLTPSGDSTKTLLKELPAGEGGGISMAVEGTQLVMTQAVYGAEDPNCCPSQLRITTYAWNGVSLAVQSVRTDANPAGGAKTTPAPTP